MWSIDFERVRTASPERLWARYEATDRAPVCDPLIGQIHPDRPFAMGATGQNKPRTGPSVRDVITEYEQLVSYTEVSRAPGASMAFGHRITDCGDGRWLVGAAGPPRCCMRWRPERGLPACTVPFLPVRYGDRS